MTGRRDASRLLRPSALRAVVMLVLVWFGAAPAARAQPSAEARRFIGAVEDGLRTLHRSVGNAAELRAGCAGLVERALDVARIADAAAVGLGDRVPASYRGEFQAAVRVRLAGECVRLVRESEGEGLEIVAARRADTVTTRTVTGTGAVRIVVWRLTPGGPFGMRAVDLSADGRDLVGTLRQEAQAALDSTAGDVPAMLRSLRR